MRIGLISDTHAPRFWKAMPTAVARAFDGVDLILHAGDVCRPHVLDDLAGIAPVRCALGNNDGADVRGWGAEAEVHVELAGVRVAVVHETGSAAGRMPRLRRASPDTDVVVFGHSHIPWDQTYDGLRALNPGSPTDRRRQPHGTVMVLDLTTGQAQLVEVS